MKQLQESLKEEVLKGLKLAKKVMKAMTHTAKLPKLSKRRMQSISYNSFSFTPQPTENTSQYSTHLFIRYTINLGSS